MSRRKSLLSFASLLFFILICAAQEGPEREERISWSCPKDWKVFRNAERYECLWASVTAATSFDNAAEFCKTMDSNLVTVQSKEKWTFVQDLIETSDMESIWMGLRQRLGNNVATWWTEDGEKRVSYTPMGFRVLNSYYRCIVMNSDGSWRYKSCSSQYRMFVCEKPIKCEPEYFGGRCEKKCHCHGQTCNFKPSNEVCHFGCLSGWMGKACDIRREKASVAYLCIHSGNSEGRVSIEIDTKGITYRHIQAIDKKDTTYPWCNDTDIYMPEPEKFVNINIQVTETAMAEMKAGQCAGQQVSGSLYEWRIALQEWEGIFMPDDQVVLIRCNFSDAETLSRSGGAKVNGKMALGALETKETKEEVVLEVADAATEGKLISTFVGAPVLLKVQFGLSKGSMVKSIFPYNCEATTADGSRRLRLLDSNGCQVDGSPVEPFVHAEDNNTIITPWFPYFTFHGHSEVFFQCSFIFCYDTSCGMGCEWRMHGENELRHMRSTNGYH